MALQGLRSVRHLGAALAFAAGAMLAACSSDEEFDWTAPRRAAEPDVSVTEFRHEVAFAPGRDALTPVSENQLRRFLAEVGADRRDHVYVVAVAPASGVTAPEALLAQRQSASVMTALAGQGVAGEPRFAPAQAPDAQPWGVTVIVHRTTVTLPECPDWRGPPGANADNRPMSNWSCSTAVNLGLMVADPDDLRQGRNPGAADGQYLARSVENYRKGRTRDLIRDAASSELYPSVAPSSTTSNGTN